MVLVEAVPPVEDLKQPWVAVHFQVLLDHVYRQPLYLFQPYFLYLLKASVQEPVQF